MSLFHRHRRQLPEDADVVMSTYVGEWGLLTADERARCESFLREQATLFEYAR